MAHKLTLVAPDSVALQWLCRDVEFEHDCKPIIESMYETMADPEKPAIGMAANQVGLNMRLITINCRGVKFAMINPRIIGRFGGTEVVREGCVSFPDRFCDVERHKVVKVWHYAPDWQSRERKLTGLLARVVQHEIDHINGLSMFDRVRLGPGEPIRDTGEQC